MRGITIRAHAARVPCSDHYAYQVLNGHTRPSRRFVERTSELLDLPPDELFRDLPDDLRVVA